jgi:sulfur carrier protein ThiS
MDSIEVTSCGELQVPENEGRDNFREHVVAVSVNGLPVKLLGNSETGKEIKTAAIEQGVPIHLHFVLEEDLPDGGHREITDHEEVRLHEGLRFTARAKKHVVIVSVNEQPVKLEGHMATGAEIKAAAIAQGVHIQPNFVLQEELPNGTSRIVGDNDEVHLREHLRFTAIAPDDNS